MKKQTIQVLQQIIFALGKQSQSHLLQSKVFSSMGLSALAKKFSAHYAEEVDFVGKMTERLLDLGSASDLAGSYGDAYPVFADVVSVFEHERELSEAGLAALESVLSSDTLDLASYELFKAYYLDELEDLNYTLQQLELIELIGKKNYLAKQL